MKERFSNFNEWRKNLEGIVQNVNKEVFRLKIALEKLLVGKYKYSENQVLSNNSAIFYLLNTIYLIGLFSIRFVSEDVIEFSVPINWYETSTEDGTTSDECSQNEIYIDEAIKRLDAFQNEIVHIKENINIQNLDIYFNNVNHSLKYLKTFLKHTN